MRSGPEMIQGRVVRIIYLEVGSGEEPSLADPWPILGAKCQQIASRFPRFDATGRQSPTGRDAPASCAALNLSTTFACCAWA
jgi:hypothetical protein